MKKFLSICVCISLLCFLLGMTTPASAAEKRLPDGGSYTNTGCEVAYGRTSGGEAGYMNVRCEVGITHGGLFTTDKITATMTSDVRSGLSATVTAVIWYATSDASGSDYDTVNSPTIPDEGLSVVISGPNDYAYKGTGGYNISSTNRGNWVAGTTVEA